MICPNCKSQVVEDAYFCPNCGTNLQVLKEKNMEIETNTKKSVIQPPASFIPSDNSVSVNNKKKNFKVSKIILAIIIVALVSGIGYTGFSYFSKNNNDKNNNDDNSEIKEEPKEEIKKYNSFEKIQEDYNKGNLSLNDYFTQLVYLEVDSVKVDSKYKSDYDYYTTGCEINIDEILDKYYDQLDQNIVKLYLTNKTLANVELGDAPSSVQPQLNNSNDNYEVKPVKDSNDIGNASNHRLNKVYVSSNEHFLIWYANYGDDAITDEQLKLLADGLESSISKFEQYFGISYSYDPYIDNKLFNDDWKNAKEVLIQNNISTSILKKAMSVYVYNTGSEHILAYYTDAQDAAKWINRSIILDMLDEDGIINYPSMVINRAGFSDNNSSLIQLYNHELFHHMQYLFCKSTNNERCVADTRLYEGIANFASSIVSDVPTSNNFLNNWAGIYTRSTSDKLSDIVDGRESYGYALFPYFYSYYKTAGNSAKVLIEAHNEKDPFGYIENNTSKQDLIKTINDLAYDTISQDYDNKSLISNEGIKYKMELKDKNIHNLTINAGAIDYFELNSKTDLSISTNNNDYLTIKVYGYKDGTYKELKSSSDKIEIDTAFYVNYDKVYLAVTNGDLINSYNYTINVEDSKVVKNSDYVTTFNNYNIEIIMNTKTSGISVKQSSVGVVDELHQKEYLSVDTTTMGFTISNKIYYDFNTGYTYTSDLFGNDAWTKEKGTAQMVDLGKILNKLINMKDVTKVADNHYKVHLTKNDIKDLMESAKSDTSKIKGEVMVDVYTSNGYIIKLEYDFSKIVSGFDLFTTTINISNYDKAGNVEIPQTIVDNAK